MVAFAGVAVPVAAQIRYDLPLVTPASNIGQVGLVRILNHSDEAGTVSIHAIDGRGARFGPITLSMAAKVAVQFDSRNLEEGNASKGLSGGVGDGTGNWRLEFETGLDIEALAYIRTPDGFLTSMHEVAVGEEFGTTEGGVRYCLPFFNPASNRSLVSSLRLINPGEEVAEISIDARDARGSPPPGGAVSLTLSPGAARTLTAQHLEVGSAGLTGRFGDAEGKWQLFISSNTPLQVMGLMQTRSGHLSNLSGTQFARSLPLVTPASNIGQVGLVRILNRSDEAGTVSIHAIDDRGERYGPVTLSMDAKAAVQFDSRNLEEGNASKGLSGGVGDGTGNWRLEFETGLDIEALAYIRTPDGFLTSMHEVAAAAGEAFDTTSAGGLRYRVPIFNPASNRSLESRLRLVNSGAARITIDALDA